MGIDPQDLGLFITQAIHQMVVEAGTVTEYRHPLVGFAAAGDPRFAELRRGVEPTHLLPSHLVPDARSAVAFFLPFAPGVVEANAEHKEQVAVEWSRAYIETNALINRTTAHLIASLAERGIRAASQPATHNYDPVSLVSPWSHKSVAVIAGLGSFGLHRMVITDSGCAGRFGSLVLDAHLPVTQTAPRERCLYFYDGSCLECVARCPVGALSDDGSIDKQRCNRRLLAVKEQFKSLGIADVCGKCAIGPCSLGSAV